MIGFKIIVGDNSGGFNNYPCFIIDLLEDRAYGWYSSGFRVFNGDISDRNSELSATQYSPMAIFNNTVNSVAICRDPNGGTDHFGRPLHYWMAGQATKASIYNPITNAIYDSAAGTVPLQSVDIAPSGYYAVVTDDTYDYTRIGLLPVDSITADGFVETALTVNNVGGNVWSLGFPSDPAGTTFNKIVDGGILGGPISVGGSNQGAFIVHWPPVVNSGEHGIIKMTSTYVTPYMKGTRVAAYPLDSVTDRSGNGFNLTNNGATLSASGGPLGGYATFDGVSDYMMHGGSTGRFDAGGVNSLEFVVSCYVKSATTSNPIVTPRIYWSNHGTSYIALYFNTNGQLNIEMYDGSTTKAVTSTADFFDAKWHSVVGQSDGTDLMLYVDGILIGSTNVSGSMSGGANYGSDLHVGSNSTSGQYFAGSISNMQMGTTAWTEDEVALEYQRMQAGLAGFTTLLTADDIDSVQIAPSGEYAIVTAGNVAHVMDPRTGIILSTDAVGAGTLNDAAIWQNPGADLPSRLLGASGTVEAKQEDERMGG